MMIETIRRSCWYRLRRGIRILAESVPAFLADEGVLRAAALTYYTIFAIVPIFALLFGVAKGFGLEAWFKGELHSHFQAHDTILPWLYNFANTTLHEARGGVVAGIGALLLCWTVVKMVGNAEKAFNQVWHVSRNRTIFRKFTDYLPVLIIVPVLLLAAGSATVLVSTRLKAFTESHAALSTIGLPLIEFGVIIVPYFLNWVLFSFLYQFLPNTRVRWGAAVFGGIIAGTLLQLLQNGYIFVQMALSRYNVIYGSFSALPLFLIWVDLNWLIVLFGVNLSRLWQEFDFDRELNHEAALASADRRRLALRLAAETAHRFELGDPPPGRRQLAKCGRLSQTLTAELLEELAARHILIPVAGTEYEEPGYVPALPPEKLTVAEFLSRWDDWTGGGRCTSAADRNDALEARLASLAAALRNAGENCPLAELVK